MLNHDYHDALLKDVSFDPSQGVTLSFALYPVFYPEGKNAAVHLDHVFNIQSFTEYLTHIVTEMDKDPNDPGLVRCEEFSPDRKRASSEGSQYLYLALDSYGGFRIHCKRVQVSAIFL